MKEIWKRLLGLVLAVCLLAVGLPVSAGAYCYGDYERISGENRFETAFQVAERLRQTRDDDKFQTIVIASGTNFADALSGSYLAATRGAPILLSYNDEYNARVQEYIRANLVPEGTVYILGGPSAVPESMEEGLAGYDVRRLAGENRFETNLAILQEAGVEGREILVCTGSNFADSLSASAVGLPILLVFNESGALTQSQTEYLEGVEHGGFCVVGGEDAVGTAIETALDAYGETDRLAGKNRFETSVLVAERFFEDPSEAVLAYAWNYPDGLCGGPLAYAYNRPLILTMTCYEHQAQAYLEKHDIHFGDVLGGEKLISHRSAELIFSRNDVPGHLMDSEITHPTCKTTGYETHTCRYCGYSYRAGELEKWPHMYENVKVTAATCLKEGSVTYSCKWCDKSYSVKLESTGHTYRPMTILGVGTWYDCANCDYSTEPGEDPGIVCKSSAISTTATKHSWGEWLTVTAPTEDAKGSQERECGHCSKTETRELAKLEPGHTHSWKLQTTRSTCTGQGYTLFSCTGCGVSYKGRVTYTLGHDVDWVITKEATPEAWGQEEGTCKRCGSFQDRFVMHKDYVPQGCENHDLFVFKTGHGSCTIPATKYYYCNGCYIGMEEVFGDLNPDNHSLLLLYTDGEYQYCWCGACGIDKVLFAGEELEE